MHKITMHQQRFWLIVTLVLCLLPQIPLQAQAGSDREQLGKAMEYFQTGKYHEALLLFAKLERNHKLSPRLQAYIGLCHFYEQDYKNAADRLDAVLPELNALSPQEQSIYNFQAAESHFYLEEYAKAIPYYEICAKLCHDSERADVFFHLGFCHLQLGTTAEALNIFRQSLDNYRQYGVVQEKKSRLIQLEKIIKGLENEVRNDSANKE